MPRMAQGLPARLLGETTPTPHGDVRAVQHAHGCHHGLRMKAVFRDPAAMGAPDLRIATSTAVAWMNWACQPPRIVLGLQGVTRLAV